MNYSYNTSLILNNILLIDIKNIANHFFGKLTVERLHNEGTTLSRWEIECTNKKQMKK